LQKATRVIPKIFHFIWIGDETKRPDNCIRTWRDAHPDWEFRIWGNHELKTRPWANFRHMEAMLPREFNGVADMMRWEILHEHGGVLFDADSVCVRPIDDELLDCPAFACWENEIVRPGLIAAGYFGCEPGNPFVRQIIEDIAASPSVIEDVAWKTVGAQRLTDCYREHAYSPLRIYPSHYFIPKHFSGQEYRGDGPVYAHQLWGSTLRNYDDIHRATIDVRSNAGKAARPLAPAKSGRSALEDQHDPYFVQRVEVGTELSGLGRLEVFASLCAGKRVLHVGCADWPITDPRTSLHVALEQHCAKLDGFDVHAEALNQLRPFVKGGLFTDFAQVTESYDVVLVPEVMEHVSDVAGFLAQLEAVDASCFLISVPDAFQCRERHFDFVEKTQTFIEVVHPDHNAWYTPYTFSNTIRKYSGLQVERLWFFNRISILALLSRPSLALAA
jgi:mannosyltransferase OCH1-like enzyme